MTPSAAPHSKTGQCHVCLDPIRPNIDTFNDDTHPWNVSYFVDMPDGTKRELLATCKFSAVNCEFPIMCFSCWCKNAYAMMRKGLESEGSW